MSADTEKSSLSKKQLSFKGIIFFLIISLGLMTFLPGLALILFIGLLPTVGALISDPTKARAQAFCVGGCNIAGLVPLIHELYGDKFKLQAAYGIIHNDVNLLLILCASAVGWGIFFAVPVITIAFYKTRDKTTLIKMVRRYDELKETWGDALPPSPTIDHLKQKNQK
ncbi:MAG: hypothetical protein K0M45_11230 [Candidatus Paracaedibacteraceae bacterium]|nr:hypothetical protein [Candidatus Paracaedibacteraceae bacterium]